MKKINKTLIALALTIPMATSTAFASGNTTSTERDENIGAIGFGGGAAFGAVVGGPVGAVAGALVGGLIGQLVSFEDYSQEQDNVIANMSQRNLELEEVSDLYAQNQVEIANLKAALNEKNIELELAMDIQFRTNSAEIEPHFQYQLDEIAFLMHQQPNMFWDLEGHADVRGHQDYNLQLSQKRVESVYNYLVSRGVAPEQLIQTAYGAQLAIETEGDRDGYFFDRRVSLKASPQSTKTANN